MTRLAEVWLALLGLALLHWGIQAGSKKAGRTIGKFTLSAIRKPLIAILTPRYRKKAIQRLQEDRKKKGLPPLENPDLP